MTHQTGKKVGIGDFALGVGTGRTRESLLHGVAVGGVTFSGTTCAAKPLALIGDMHATQLPALGEDTALCVVSAGAIDAGALRVLAREASRRQSLRIGEGEANRRANLQGDALRGLLLEARHLAPYATIVLLGYAPLPFRDSRLFAHAAPRLERAQRALGWTQFRAAADAGVLAFNPAHALFKQTRATANLWRWRPQPNGGQSYHLSAFGEWVVAKALGDFLTTMRDQLPHTRFGLPCNPGPLATAELSGTGGEVTARLGSQRGTHPRLPELLGWLTLTWGTGTTSQQVRAAMEMWRPEIGLTEDALEPGSVEACLEAIHAVAEERTRR